MRNVRDKIWNSLADEPREIILGHVQESVWATVRHSLANPTFISIRVSALYPLLDHVK